MPKAKKPRSAVKSRTNADPMAAKGPTGTVDARSLSRGQRKRQAKREALQKRKTLSSLVPASAKGKVLDDFGTLSAALETAAAARSKVAAQQAASSQKPSSRVSQKRRQRIAALETGQLSAVLAHPAFQSDPFAAIQEHLKNTVVEPKG